MWTVEVGAAEAVFLSIEVHLLNEVLGVVGVIVELIAPDLVDVARSVLLRV